MADLESRVEKLESQIQDLRLTVNNSLNDIKSDVKEIKACIKGDTETETLQKQLIQKDVLSNSERIKKLEDNQAKVVWAIILEVLGLVGSAVLTYLKMGGK